MDPALTLEALKTLQAEIQRQEIQHAAEEGARLHTEKNSPWVSGMYTHLKFPPYVFKAYPKMLYGAGYTDAIKALEAVKREFVGRDRQGEHDARVAHYQREIDTQTRVVQDEGAEAIARGQGWVESPAEVEAAKIRAQDAEALAAAESNFDDRRLGELAARERDAVDAASDGHLIEIPVARKTGRRIDPA